MKNKKTIATSCSDNFLPGLLVMLYSFGKYHRGYDIVVMYNDKVSPLSKDNIKRILKCNKNARVLHVDVDHYIIKKKDPNAQSFFEHLFPAYMSFEMLRLLSEYQRVVYIDSDILFLGDISESIFNEKYDITISDIAGPLDDERYCGKNYAEPGFSAGIISIGDWAPYVGMYERATVLVPLNRKPFADQPVWNAIIAGEQLYIMPKTHHGYKRWMADSVGGYDSKYKSIHFAGPKPWLGGEHDFSEIEQLWFDCYDELCYIYEIEEEDWW